MSDSVLGLHPALSLLEKTQINGNCVRLQQLQSMDKTSSRDPIALFLLLDIKKLLPEPIADQTCLQKLTKMQKRFFTFDELDKSSKPSQASSNASPFAGLIPCNKSGNLDPKQEQKIAKVTSKASGVWFVTVEAALKLVFKFCSPQDSIRISLDLSPFLVATYASSYKDPLDVLENINVENLPKQFKDAMESKMKDKKSTKVPKFSGSDAVDYLVKSGAAASRSRAIEVGQRLVSSGLFQHVSLSSSSTASKFDFQDKSSEFYTFETLDSISSNTSASGSSPKLSSLQISNPGSPQIGQKSSSSANISPRDSPRSPSSTPRNASIDSTLQEYLPHPFNIFILGSEKSGKSTIFSALTATSKKSTQTPFNVSYSNSINPRPWNHVCIETVNVSLQAIDENNTQNVSMSYWDFDNHHSIYAKSASSSNLSPKEFEGHKALSYFVHRAHIMAPAKNACLVLFDLNQFNLIELDYWIASITSHSPQSPIIIVGTHSDTISAKQKSNTKLFVTKRYAKVKNVRDYISINSKLSKDIEKLRQNILQHSLTSLLNQLKKIKGYISTSQTSRNSSPPRDSAKDTENLAVSRNQTNSNSSLLSQDTHQLIKTYIRAADSSQATGLLSFVYYDKIENVITTLNKLRESGTTFYLLDEIRRLLSEQGIPESLIEDALNYLTLKSVILRVTDHLDIYTCMYGKAESDLKRWAILDYNFFFKITYALNAAPPMFKMRGLISLESILEAWKTIELPKEFMLDCTAYFYHQLKMSQCMLSLLISTVTKEAEMKATTAVVSNDNQNDSSKLGSCLSLPPEVTTQSTSSTPSVGGYASVLSRIPNPSAHCFAIPFAIPRSFDPKTLSWATQSKNELVRIYSFDRLPGQLLERSAMQLILAMLSQLRTPFLSKIEGQTENSMNSKDDSSKKEISKEFSKVEPKALQDITCEHIEWNQQGISFTVAGDLGFSARLYSVEGPDHETALVIRSNSDSFTGSTRGLRLVLDNINAFVLWEYKNALSDIFIPCCCNDCLKARSNPKYIPLPVFKSAATFTLEECERAIGAGFSSLLCSIYGNDVPLDKLVPDIVMSDLNAFQVDYEEIIKEKELARSSNGIVYKGRLNNEVVAIKEITVNLDSSSSTISEIMAEFRHEVWVSSLLKHQNVVSLKAFSMKSEVAEDGSKVALLAIVMEFIPCGDLYDWLHEKETINWDTRLRIALEIAEGMHFLHTLDPPILHHDLKSANIFVVDKNNVDKSQNPNHVICRVGDFGEARTDFSFNSREKVDNPLWLAPEVMQKQRYDAPADVYAFGIILWEICSREHPFEEYPEGRSVFKSVLEDAIIAGLRPSIDNKLEPELPLSANINRCIPMYANLMKECWQHDRRKRPTFARIISTLQDIRVEMMLNEQKSLKDVGIDQASAEQSAHADFGSHTPGLKWNMRQSMALVVDKDMDDEKMGTYTTDSNVTRSTATQDSVGSAVSNRLDSIQDESDASLESSDEGTNPTSTMQSEPTSDLIQQSNTADATVQSESAVQQTDQAVKSPTESHVGLASQDSETKPSLRSAASSIGSSSNPNVGQYTPVSLPDLGTVIDKDLKAPVALQPLKKAEEAEPWGASTALLVETMKAIAENHKDRMKADRKSSDKSNSIESVLETQNGHDSKSSWQKSVTPKVDNEEEFKSHGIILRKPATSTSKLDETSTSTVGEQSNTN